MSYLKETRRLLAIALIVLFSIDVLCGVVLISPIGQRARSGHQRLQQLWAQLQARTRETAPLQGIDQKVIEAKDQINSFYGQRFPQRFATVPEQIGKLASESGVTITSVNYKTEPSEMPGVTRVMMEATLHGDYTHEVRFINSLERSRVFFIINSISLGEQVPTVQLQVKFETYVKSEAA